MVGLMGELSFTHHLVSSFNHHRKSFLCELEKRLSSSCPLSSYPLDTTTYYQAFPATSKKDKKKIKIGILIGTLIPFVIYFVWEAVFLGMIPVEGDGGFLEAMEKGTLASQLLRREINHPLTAALAEGFAFFAIVTSFLAVSSWPCGLSCRWASPFLLQKTESTSSLPLNFGTSPKFWDGEPPPLFERGFNTQGGLG